MNAKNYVLALITSLLLVGCHTQPEDPSPMASNAVGNISQKNICKDILRQMVDNQARRNAASAWQSNNAMQELRNEYHEHNCGELS